MRGRRAHVRCFGRRWYIEAFLSRCLSISAKSTESLGADSNRLPLLQLRVCGQWLLGVAGVCKSAYLEGFPFPALPTVAGYCVRVRVKLGSMVSRVRGQNIVGRSALDRRVGMRTAYPLSVSIAQR
jgi:hypothetical protein